MCCVALPKHLLFRCVDVDVVVLLGSRLLLFVFVFCLLPTVSTSCLGCDGVLFRVYFFFFVRAGMILAVVSHRFTAVVKMASTSL